jgi:hypothetical protein
MYTIKNSLACIFLTIFAAQILATDQLPELFDLELPELSPWDDLAQPMEPLKRPRSERGESPSRKRKITSPLENDIVAEFHDHHETLIALLSLSYDGKLLPEYIQSLPKNSYKNWMILATAIYLTEKHMSLADICTFIKKLRQPQTPIPGLTEAWLKKAYEEFTALTPKHNPFCFRSTFASIMTEYFVPLLKGTISEDKIQLMNAKLAHLQSVKRDKDFVQTERCLANAELLEELLGEISDEHEDIKQWVLKNVNDISIQVALLSVLTEDDLIAFVIDSPDTLKNSKACAAISVYLTTLKVPSNIICSFVLKIRRDLGNLVASTPGNLHKVYTTLKMPTNKKIIPRCYQGHFAEILIDYLEPLLKRIIIEQNNNDQIYIFENNDVLTELYNKYKTFTPEESPLHNISDRIYFDLLKTNKIDTVADYINNLPLTNSQKAALLSIVNSVDEKNTNLVTLIRSLKPNLYQEPRAMALCVYLRHFGVPSAKIYEFFSFIKGPYPERCSFGQRSAQTIFANYSKLTAQTLNRTGVFRGDFSIMMMEYILPMFQRMVEDPQAELVNQNNLAMIYQIMTNERK